MDVCPLCGSELACEDGLLTWRCCSPECGACFQDVNLGGAARRIAAGAPDKERRTNSGSPTPSAT